MNDITWTQASEVHSHYTVVIPSLVPRPSAPRPFRKIGEGKMEGGSGKRAYYLVQLRWNVSGAN